MSTLRSCSTCWGFRRPNSGDQACFAEVLVQDPSGDVRQPGPDDFCIEHATPDEVRFDMSLLAEGLESMGGVGFHIAATAVMSGRQEVHRIVSRHRTTPVDVAAVNPSTLFHPKGGSR